MIFHYDFDRLKTKKLFFTNLHIIGVRKTFEKLEKELAAAFESSAEDKAPAKCPVCKPIVPECPPNKCPPLPECPKPTVAPSGGSSLIPLGGVDSPPAPYDKEDPNAPSKKYITYKRIYDFFTQAGFQIDALISASDWRRTSLISHQFENLFKTTEPRTEKELLLFKVDLELSFITYES